MYTCGTGKYHGIKSGKCPYCTHTVCSCGYCHCKQRRLDLDSTSNVNQANENLEFSLPSDVKAIPDRDKERV